MRWSGVVIFGAVVLVAGCGRNADSPGSGGGQIQGEAASSAPAVLRTDVRQMAEAVPGSGNAPVEVHFDLAAAPTAGRPFTLQLAVVAKAPAPVVRLDAVTDGGITVLQPTLPVTLEKVEQGVPGLTTLTIRGDAAGVALLRVSVTLESPTGNESKSFMVPVIIGERRD